MYATDPATGDRTRTSEGDASALRAKLGPNKIAVFAGAYHVGVISQQPERVEELFGDSADIVVYEPVPGGEPTKGSLAAHAGS